MNFFGHAVLAHRRRPEPRFIFGSMLPDFVSIIGAPARGLLERVDREDVRDGVRFHLRTDEVFHSIAPFSEILEESREALRAAGVRRGSRLAASHLGAELLLDASLLGDKDALLACRNAVRLAESERHGLWSSIDSHRRTPLVTRILDGTLPEGYGDVGFVFERIERRLWPRERLRLTPRDGESVRRHLPRLRDLVTSRAGALLEGVSACAIEGFEISTGPPERRELS